MRLNVVKTWNYSVFRVTCIYQLCGRRWGVCQRKKTYSSSEMENVQHVGLEPRTSGVLFTHTIIWGGIRSVTGSDFCRHQNFLDNVNVLADKRPIHEHKCYFYYRQFQETEKRFCFSSIMRVILAQGPC